MESKFNQIDHSNLSIQIHSLAVRKKGCVMTDLNLGIRRVVILIELNSLSYVITELCSYEVT